LTQGLELDDGPAKVEGMELQLSEHDRSRVLVVVTEGRYRMIRRAFEALGYEVLRLKRMKIGPVRLGSLKLNETRPLSGDEIMQLKNLTGQGETAKSKAADGAVKVRKGP
jgi:23S rRNA pseudouridine2605 synthase